MRSTSTDGGPRRGWLGAVIAVSLGIAAIGTGYGFAAVNQDQTAQQVKTCDATFVSGGGTTASGEKSNPKSLTAGSSVFPIGTMVKVTNPATAKSVTVRVNDKNSFCIAMQPAAFEKVRTPGKNLIRGAKVEAVKGGSAACAPDAGKDGKNARKDKANKEQANKDKAKQNAGGAGMNGGMNGGGAMNGADKAKKDADKANKDAEKANKDKADKKS